MDQCLKTSREQNCPTFSVIIATHNRAHLLGRAIRSVLVQTYQDFELIIVDDASPDNTQEVVEAFEDDRIIYIQREKNGGASATRNTGILRARGKYISFLDDDDEYLPEFLAETYRVFEAALENVGFVWCGILEVNDTTEKEEAIREILPSELKFASREEAFLYFLRVSPLGSGWGLTIRSSCFNVIGLFDENLRASVDRELLIRLVHQFDFQIIPKALVKVYKHSGPQITKDVRERAKTFERIIEKNRATLNKHPDLLVILLYWTSRLHYYAQNKIKGRQYLLQALQIKPLRLKTWLGFVFFESSGTRAPHLHRQISHLISPLYSLNMKKVRFFRS